MKRRKWTKEKRSYRSRLTRLMLLWLRLRRKRRGRVLVTWSTLLSGFREDKLFDSSHFFNGQGNVIINLVILSVFGMVAE